MEPGYRERSNSYNTTVYEPLPFSTAEEISHISRIELFGDWPDKHLNIEPTPQEEQDRQLLAFLYDFGTQIPRFVMNKCQHLVDLEYMSHNSDFRR